MLVWNDLLLTKKLNAKLLFVLKYLQKTRDRAVGVAVAAVKIWLRKRFLLHFYGQKTCCCCWWIWFGVAETGCLDMCTRGWFGFLKSG